MATKTKIDVEQEILDATGTKPKKEEEKKNDYYIRLVRAIHGLPEKQWDKLPDEVQQWYDTNVTHMDEKEPLEGFEDAEEEPERPMRRPLSSGKKTDPDEPEDAGDEPDGDGDDGDEPDDDLDEELEEEEEDEDKEDPDEPEEEAVPVSKKPAAKKPAAKDKEADAEKKSKAKAALRRIVVEKPELDLDKVMAKLEKAGVEIDASEAKFLRLDTLATLKVVTDLGWKKPAAPKK